MSGEGSKHYLTLCGYEVGNVYRWNILKYKSRNDHCTTGVA